MPAARYIPTRHDVLSSMSVAQLQALIAQLNSTGAAITPKGNKPLLIQRIIRHERGESLDLTAPAISTERVHEIDSQVALALTANVSNETEKLFAANILRGLSALADIIRLDFDPNLENWRAQVESARQGLIEAERLQDRHLDKVLGAIEKIKARIATYDLEQDRVRLEEHRKIEQVALSIATDSAIERVYELEHSGDTQRARELEQAIDSGSLTSAALSAVNSLPVAQPTKVAGVSTRMVWRWKLVNLGLLTREYTRTIADVPKIDDLVKSQGDRAIDILGAGSVEIYREADTRRTGR